MGAACPALADVGTVRYSISGSQPLLDVEKDLMPFDSISRTNAPDYFAEMTVFAIADIDPAAVLVARSAPQAQDDSGPYRLLFVFGGNSDPAWPGLCQYLTADRRAVSEQCDAVPSP